MGKSRVIAAAIVLKTLSDGSVDFNIVFTTPLLKGVDEQVYKQLEKLLSLSINMVVYDPSSTLKSQLKAGYLIIDEADQILLDHQADVPDRQVLALSATSFTEDLAFEKEYLRSELRFHVLDSKIASSVEKPTGRTPLEMFFSKAAGYAKIIYCKD